MRSQHYLAVFLTCLGSLLYQGNGLTQIIPDTTLGTENSVVNSTNTNFHRIDGGAVRGSNLFHSFQDFSIPNGHSAYFSNPALIQTIFSRVTGNNPSNIMGTLGVLGDANLVFMNPHGVVFGQNASLDISGSFVVTTSDSIRFPDGNQFSAVNPQGIPLLTIDVPVLVGLVFEGDPTGKIYNQGDLAVSRNLSFIASDIVNNGSLTALTGDINLDARGINAGNIIINGTSDKVSLLGENLTLTADNNIVIEEAKIGAIEDLNLTAQNTVKIRDSVLSPVQIVSGKDLTIQGNQLIDIFALNHPQSILFSGADMVFRSANTVAGDAHYYSGGSFTIEQLDGELGGLYSPNDPIIRSQGDVKFFAYSGTSLHILSGSSVDIDTILITGADTTGNAIQGEITLSDGTTVEIDGTIQPTLDIRAGMNPDKIGTPLGTDGTSGSFLDEAFNNVAPPMNNSTSPTVADITIGSILISANEGIVILTNQYEPNNNLLGGNILLGEDGLFSNGIDTSHFSGNAGNVFLDSRGQITVNKAIETDSSLGNGGDVTLLAQDDIVINSDIISSGVNAGNILIQATGDISIANSTIDTTSNGNGNGGNVSFQETNNVSLINSTINTTSINDGNAGNILINATGDISLENSLLKSDIGNNEQDESDGNVGTITLDGQSISLTNTNLQAGFFTNAKGEKGLISLHARDGILLDDSDIRADVFFGGIGDSSDVTIKANSVTIQNNSRLIATNQGNTEVLANAGNITIDGGNSLTITSDSKIVSNIGVENGNVATGNVGNIQLEAKDISISDSRIEAGVFADSIVPEVGTVNIKADNSILLNQSSILANTEGSNQANGSDVSLSATSIQLINSKIFTNSESLGDSGSINIFSNTFSLQNNSSLSSDTLGQGNSGSIEINVSDKITLSEGSLIESDVQKGAIGHSEGIIIQTNTLSLEDGSSLSTSALGEGDAGAINITANENISLSGINNLGNGSFILSDVFSNATGNSQGITIQTGTLSLNDGARISATTRGEGDSGKINITANESISLSGKDSIGLESRILSEVRTIEESTAMGDSQGITIQTNTLSLNDGARISASTNGDGDAGTINITANESISLSGVNSGSLGSFIQSQVETGATGNSQGISIETNTLTLTDGARISATTRGDGEAGAINITANESISLTGVENVSTEFNSRISANTRRTGNANNITINTPQLTLSEGAIITAQTSSSGNSGTITIEGANIVNLGTDTSLIVETSGSGKPGNINLNTNTLTIGEDAQLSATATDTSTNTEGGGSINLNANTINVSGELGIFAETNSIAPAGNLIINPNNSNTLNLTFTDEGFISASTTSQGNGGNIDITAPQLIDISGEGTVSVTTSGRGNAGRITIDSQQLNFSNGLEITASTTGQGNAGDIVLKGNRISLDNTQINAFTDKEGVAGNILISNQDNTNAEQVTLNNQSTLSTEIQANSILPNNHPLSNIDIKTDNLTVNSSIIRTSTDGQGNAGNITIPNAQTINLNQSRINASTSGKGNAGAINLTASDSISLSGQNTEGEISIIVSEVESGGQGNSEGINITTNSLFLDDGAVISASTSGKGNAGAISINATDTISLLGSNSEERGSTIVSRIREEGQGNSEGINITTSSLFLDNGAVISASTSGKGNAGLININAINTISLSGFDRAGRRSVIVSEVQSEGQGNSQGININTNSLSLDNGTVISASTSGQGNAGAINITTADSISLSGFDRSGRISAIFSQVRRGAEGNSEGITINTNSLFLNDGAVISASTFSRGNAGAININAADTISFSGVNQLDLETTGSGVFSIVDLGAEGNSEGINITATSLLLNDGARIAATARGQGNAGTINLDISQNISLSGVENNGQGSQILSQTEGVGQANNITIITPQLNLTDGATISAKTDSAGNSGTITIQEADIVNLGANTNLTVETSGSGKPGNINISANTLNLENNAQLSATATSTSTNTEGGGSINLNTSFLNISGQLGIFAETQGQSPAGNLTVSPYNNNPNLNIRFVNNGFISAKTTSVGEGGDIFITAPQTIDIRGMGQITVETSGSGSAGIIEIISPTINLAEGLEISASTTGTGNAGNLNLSGNIINLNQTEITASTTSSGNAGEITLNATDTINLDTNSTINSRAELGATGDGGNINLQTPNLSLNNQSQISTSSQGGNTADAGTINLNSNQTTLNNASQIAATTSGGKGGNINLNGDDLNLTQGSQIRTTTEGENDAGDINVILNESLIISGDNSGIFADSGLNAQGNSGNIFIDPPLVFLSDNATISVNNQGQGIGGNLTLFADNLILDQATILAQTASNTGGNITLNITDTLLMTSNSEISATAGTSQSGGDGGNIIINAAQIFSNLYGNNRITANAFTGNGGNIVITADTLYGFIIGDAAFPISTITASSNFGFDGNIILNTPDINPLQGIETLPETNINPQVQQGCQIGKQATTEFYVLGKGGISLLSDALLTPNGYSEMELIPLTDTSLSHHQENLQFFSFNSNLLQLPCQN
ncbi:MAG: filamentous hemagglutinin N-terminal domain-containing protein [Microcystaceae cyanobacterium]